MSFHVSNNKGDIYMEEKHFSPALKAHDKRPRCFFFVCFTCSPPSFRGLKLASYSLSGHGARQRSIPAMFAKHAPPTYLLQPYVVLVGQYVQPLGSLESLARRVRVVAAFDTAFHHAPSPYSSVVILVNFPLSSLVSRTN